MYRQASASVTFRSREEITDLFGGLELVPPGLAYVPDWRPAPPYDDKNRRSRWLLGGVGLVPAAA